MKTTVIPIVIGALVTVTKGQIKGLETWKQENKGRPSKLLHCYDRPEYWEDSWRLEEICCHSNFSRKPVANAGVKNS